MNTADNKNKLYSATCLESVFF